MRILLATLAFTTALVAEGHLRGLAANDKAQAPTEYDCDSGCDLKGPRVCGVDGNTYSNECLAFCQGIEVEKNGVCPGDPPGQEDVYDEDGVADAETIGRFKSEKFKLVGKLKNFEPFEEDMEDAVEDPEEPGDTEDPPDEKKEKKNGNGNGQGNQGNNGNGQGNQGNGNGNNNGNDKIRARRVSNDKFEYVAELDETEAEDHSDLEPSDPIEEGEGDRQLGIYGADTRSQVGNVYSFPNRIVGEMDYGTGEGGCSGTVISRHSVLTAGHCVYKNGAWKDHSTFAPARYRTSTGATREPYGEWTWSYMTTYENWTKRQYRSYDMAVVRYYPKNGVYIGDRVGYAGLRETWWSSSALDSCTVRGYPYDVPNGEMWTSGSCSPDSGWAWSFYKIKHYCDTTGAMSGSSVMNGSGYITAIHVAGYYIDRSKSDAVTSNVAVLLYGRNFDKAKQWAGR